MDRKIFILKRKEIQLQMEKIRNDISSSLDHSEKIRPLSIGASVASGIKLLLQTQNNVLLKTIVTTVGLKALSKMLPRHFLNPFTKSN